MQSIFRDLKSKNEEDRKEEFSFGFDVEEANKAKKKKKKKRGKKGKKSTDAKAGDAGSGSDSDDEMNELMKIVSETVSLAEKDASAVNSAPIVPPGLANNVNSSIPGKDNANDESDDDGAKPPGSTDPAKKKKRKAKKKASSESGKPSQSKKDAADDDFLNAAIAKADADRVQLEKSQKEAERQKVKKGAGGKPLGPMFVSPKDPTLDASTQAKAKFGKGKNLVAVGPAKVRDTNWLHTNDMGKEGASTANAASLAATSPATKLPEKSAASIASTSEGLPADTKYHNSPFTFGFGFDF